MALVDRSGIVDSGIVSLEKLANYQTVEAIRYGLDLLHAEHGTLALLEQPYLGHDNPQTVLKLARIAGMIEAVTLAAGYRVRSMMATEWRPLAGIEIYKPAANPKKPVLRHDLRPELKMAALRLVKLEYGLETADDNLAEAVLMARVALGMTQRDAALVSQPYGRSSLPLHPPEALT